MPSSSARCAGVAVATLLVLAGVGCATSGVNRGDFNLMSLEDEWKLGQQLEHDLAAQLQLVNDREALGYLNRVGRALVDQTELRSLPWEFHIVANPELNAFNIPGGHVYVHTGLVEAADTASELVGVLAHEVAHGVARHATEQMSEAYGANILASVVLGGDPKVYERIVAQIVAQGAFASFSRDDEREADALGVRYMYSAGYDPMGMASFFNELLEQRRRRPTGVERFFSSHPLTEERIRNVTEQARSLPATGNLRSDEPGFRRMKRRL